MEDRSSVEDVTFDMKPTIIQKPLSQRDKKKIRQQFSVTIIIALFAAGLFGAIFYFILRNFSFNDGFSTIPLVMFGIVGLFFVFVIGFILSSSIKDARGGVKNVIEGVIDDKRLDIKKTTSHRSHGAGFRGSRSSSSSTKRSYFITVSGESYSITYDMFSKVNVGDLVIFEMTPKSGILLDYKILDKGEKSVEQQSREIATRRNYPNSKIKEAPLSQKEKEQLRRFFTQKRNTRLRLIGILSIPVIGILINKLPFLLVLIFPVPIIILYQLYKLIRLYLNYKNSVDANRKKLIATVVIDKTFVTIKKNNIRSVKYRLKTTYGNVYVREDIYNRITADEEIIIYQPLHMKYVLGITHDDVYDDNE